MKKVKRNIIIAAVLLFVCAAVYLNWSYNNSWGAADPAMVKAEDEKMTSLDTNSEAEPASDYFAQARLTRQTSRDEALGLLQTAASAESASQETIDSAMSAIAAMANWSMLETQLENTLIAKDFSDCVVYISGDGVTVAVPAPAEGLSEAAVARITEAVTTGTDFTADQLRVIEIKPSGTGTTDAGTAPETDDGSSSADQGGSEGTTDAGSGSITGAAMPYVSLPDGTKPSDCSVQRLMAVEGGVIAQLSLSGPEGQERAYVLLDGSGRALHCFYASSLLDEGEYFVNVPTALATEDGRLYIVSDETGIVELSPEFETAMTTSSVPIIPKSP